MTKKYISADDLFSAFEKCAWADSDDRDIAEELLLSVPAADVVEVQYGKWLQNNNSSDYFCSNCGVGFRIYAYNKNDYKYCPYCGARMDGDAQ